MSDLQSKEQEVQRGIKRKFEDGQGLCLLNFFWYSSPPIKRHFPNFSHVSKKLAEDPMFCKYGIINRLCAWMADFWIPWIRTDF